MEKQKKLARLVNQVKDLRLLDKLEIYFFIDLNKVFETVTKAAEEAGKTIELKREETLKTMQ